MDVRVLVDSPLSSKAVVIDLMVTLTSKCLALLLISRITLQGIVLSIVAPPPPPPHTHTSHTPFLGPWSLPLPLWRIWYQLKQDPAHPHLFAPLEMTENNSKDMYLHYYTCIHVYLKTWSLCWLHCFRPKTSCLHLIFSLSTYTSTKFLTKIRTLRPPSYTSPPPPPPTPAQNISI